MPHFNYISKRKLMHKHNLSETQFETMLKNGDVVFVDVRGVKMVEIINPIKPKQDTPKRTRRL